MAVTKNLRDGALFLVGDVGACAVSGLSDTAKVYQNGSWYVFNWAFASPNYVLKRRVSGTLLDLCSVAGSTVYTGDGTARSQAHVYRVGDAEWYLFFAMSGDLYVAKSTNLGVTWTTPVLAVAHGAAWCASTLAKPSVIVSGTYFYLYAVGDSDKIGAFRCLTSADPLDSGNWSACAANPLYDSAHGAVVGQVAIDSAGKVVWWGAMNETAIGNQDHFWLLDCAGAGLAFTRQRIVGTWDHGVAVNDITPVECVFNPQDGYWYFDAYATALAPCAWVSETLGGAMIRVPSVAAAYWTAGDGAGLLFPNGGLKWDSKRTVKVMRDRGAISHLRKAEESMSGSYDFAYDGNLGDVHDLLNVGTDRGLGDVATGALLLCERDYADAWGEYHLFPEAIISLGFGEGEDSDQVSLSFESPLPNPLIGRLNTGSVGSDLSTPGGGTPES